MDFKVYALAISTFTVGLVELIIGGILPMLAADLEVSVSAAGQLITIFALTFAIAGPTLLTLTAKVERKKLYLISLIVFTLGCFVAFWSPNYTVLFISRIITAGSGALITVLSLNIGVRISPVSYRARVVGIMLVGISSSLVLGVPVGVLIGEAFGWRILFLIIASLTLLTVVLIYFTMEKIETEKVNSFRSQIASLKDIKVLSAHIVTCFIFTGHYTLYAYFAPFLEETMKVEAFWISIAYFVFGLGAVLGGPFGGIISDRFGVGKSILLIIGLFALTIIALPFSTGAVVIFTILLVAWGALSWAISPPKQSYLIQIAPATAEFQQSVNYSFLQLGIALGSAVGGIVVSNSSTLVANAWVSVGLLIVAFLIAIFSLTRSKASATTSVASSH